MQTQLFTSEDHGEQKKKSTWCIWFVLRYDQKMLKYTAIEMEEYERLCKKDTG